MMPRARMTAGAFLLATLIGTAMYGSALAQDASPVGDWEGTLIAPGAEYPLVLHVTEGDDGTLGATMDSPSQAAFGIAGGEVTFEDGLLSISFPDIAGGYEGMLSEDGGSLTGTWSQGGMSLDLNMTRSEG